jgi:hypothetical protein
MQDSNGGENFAIASVSQFFLFSLLFLLFFYLFLPIVHYNTLLNYESPIVHGRTVIPLYFHLVPIH